MRISRGTTRINCYVHGFITDIRCALDAVSSTIS